MIDRQWISRLVRWARTAGNAAASGGRVFLQVDGPPPVAGEKQQGAKVRQIQQYGLRSVPVAGSEAVLVAVRGSVQQTVAVAADHPSQGPQTLAEGETALYCKTGTQVLLDQDGQVVITANGAVVKIDAGGKVTIDAAAGKDVAVNGGTLKVARDTEAVKPTSDMTALLGKVAAAINALAPGSILPGDLTNVSLQIGNVDGGAAHFKG